MCDRWLNDPAAFVADMGECPPEMTLERIDSNGHYEPSNCRWASKKEQARNREGVYRIDVGGEQLTLREYAAFVGVNYDALKSRVLRSGLDPKTAAMGMLERPNRPIKPWTPRKRDEAGRFI